MEGRQLIGTRDSEGFQHQLRFSNRSVMALIFSAPGRGISSAAASSYNEGMFNGLFDFQHDVFTLLADVALGRASLPWRDAAPNGFRKKLLRRLALEAGLIDRDGKTLTPLASDWLAQPALEQRHIFGEAWVAQHEAAVRQSAIEHLERWTGTEPFRVEKWLGRESAARQKAIWQPLVWLGYLQLEAKNPPTLKRVFVYSPPAEAIPWRIEGLEIVVHPPYAWEDLLALERMALLLEVGPPRSNGARESGAVVPKREALLQSPASLAPRRYILRPAHWRRARAMGFTPASALTLLERNCAEPLPVEIWKWFSPPAPDVRLQPSALVTFTNAAELARLLKRPAWRKRLGQPLSAHHAVINPAHAPLVARALERAKLTTHNSVPAPTATVPRTAGNTDRMHFLLAARVMQALARELELPEPLDAPTLGALAARLPEAQQRRLERAIIRQLERIRERLPELRAAKLAVAKGDQNGNAAAPIHPAPEVPAVLNAALSSGAVVQLHYQPPAPRPLITRAVIPLRLETWGAHTYLVAHCLYREADRTFRLDRIQTAALAELPLKEDQHK
jgi:hypothetical protein